MKNNNSDGNVLFLILIAIVLFAALSYAINSSSRSSGYSISKDQAKSSAAAILQYSTTVKNATTRLKLVNGCQDDMFDFTSPMWVRNNGTSFYTYNNPSRSPSDGRCKVFSPQGGNVSAVIPDEKGLSFSRVSGATNQKPGTSYFQVAQVSGIGSDGPSGTASSNDVIMEINWLNKETCLAINDLLGVQNPSDIPPEWTSTGTIEPYARLSNVGGTGIISSPATTGHNAFCRTVTSASDYYKFIHIIIER